MRKLNASLLIVLAIAASAASAVAQVDRRSLRTAGVDPAGIHRASCVLQLDSDANRMRPMDTQTLDALLTSTTIVDPAAQKALGLGPADWPKVAQVELTPAGQSAVRLGVSVLPDAKLPDTAAQAFLDALAAAAKAAVEQVNGRQDQSLAKRIAAAEADAQKRYDAATAALNAARPAVMSSIETDTRFALRNAGFDRAVLELTLAGQRARLRVLEDELAHLRPTTRPNDTTSIADAAVALATPAGLYERFEAERITLRCNIAEGEAKLAVMADRTTAATTAPTPADLDRLQMEQNNARQTLQTAQNQLEQLRRDRQNTGGTVRLLILDGRPDAE